MEIIVIIAVIGILAAFAIPMYQDYVRRTRVAEGIAMASPLQLSTLAYFDENGGCPRDNDMVGEDATIAGGAVTSIALSSDWNCAILITYDSKVGTNIQTENVLLLAPVYNPPGDPSGELVGWNCATTNSDFATYGYSSTHTSVPNKYRPANCRTD